MNKYEPELGQAAFGALFFDYEVPRAVSNMLLRLAEDLNPDWGADPSPGVNYENDVFAMRQYDYDEPTVNFEYKSSGLMIAWYKYIGRGMSSNKPVKVAEFRRIIKHCRESAADYMEWARSEREKQEAEYKSWLKSHRDAGHLCQDCFHFFGELADGTVSCAMDWQAEEELPGVTVARPGNVKRSYQTHCDRFVRCPFR